MRPGMRYALYLGGALLCSLAVGGLVAAFVLYFGVPAVLAGLMGGMTITDLASGLGVGVGLGTFSFSFGHAYNKARSDNFTAQQAEQDRLAQQQAEQNRLAQQQARKFSRHGIGTKKRGESRFDATQAAQLAPQRQAIAQQQGAPLTEGQREALATQQRLAQGGMENSLFNFQVQHH